MSKAERESRLIALAPTEASRAAMKQALASPHMPSVDRIPPHAQTVVNRARATIVAEAQQPRRPTIPDGVLADVQVFSTAPIREYHGGFRTIAARAGVTIGAIDGQDQPVEVYYATPDGRSIKALGRTGVQFQFDLVDDVSAALSLKRLVVLKDRIGIALFFLAEGSPRPYDRRFEKLGISVKQISSVRGERPAVQIAFGGERFRLQPGQRAIAKTPSGTFALLPLSNIQIDKPSPDLEGDPYYVSLLIYRLEP